jgi:hypothetical protein
MCPQDAHKLVWLYTNFTFWVTIMGDCQAARLSLSFIKVGWLNEEERLAMVSYLQQNWALPAIWKIVICLIFS